MLTMTTFRQIYHTAVGLADHGRRLPAVEQFAWRALAVQLQELADPQGGYLPATQAPAGYAEQVRHPPHKQGLRARARRRHRSWPAG
jgi:hypothetical protein